MRVGLVKGLILLSLLANTATAQSPHRFVVIVALPDDPRALQQQAAFRRDATALRERDVVVQTITPAAARHERHELGVEPDAVFEVLLVGKDGGVKLRRAHLVTVSEITALIDTMPMRRSEMGR